LATETKTPVEQTSEGEVAPEVEVIPPVETAAEPAADPVVEPVVETPEAEVTADTDTLLQEAGKDEAKPDKPDDKPAEEKVEGKEGEKPEEVKPPEPEPIVYEAFKLPEGVEPDADAIGKYTEVLGKHRLAQDVGQELLDLHTESLKTYADHVASEQQRIWNDTRAEWRKQVMADEQIGGSGFQTSLAAIARMRDKFQGNKSEFDNFLKVTGAGDHPAFLKFIHNVARAFDEPAPVAAAKPPASNGAKPGKRTLRDIYDHSSSTAN
jgi:hypothetical protein